MLITSFNPFPNFYFHEILKFLQVEIAYAKIYLRVLQEKDSVSVTMKEAEKEIVDYVKCFSQTLKNRINKFIGVISVINQ